MRGELSFPRQEGHTGCPSEAGRKGDGLERVTTESLLDDVAPGGTPPRRLPELGDLVTPRGAFLGGSRDVSSPRGGVPEASLFRDESGRPPSGHEGQYGPNSSPGAAPVQTPSPRGLSDSLLDDGEG